MRIVKNIKNTFLLLLSSTILMATSYVNVSAFDPFKASCNSTSTSTVCVEARKTTTNPILKTINAAVNIISLLAGVAAVFILILAGLTLITSAGNAEAAAKARKRIASALIGLVIIALAWLLITFVVNAVIK